MEIKNLKKTAERIRKAIAGREKIILYGDADLDGTSSVILLKEAIQTLGGRVVAVYFPDREKEGYGITKTGLGRLENKAPALLVVVDLGIGNFKEVLLAKKKGFEVLIVDHHEVLGKVPKADIVVDPKQKGDRYPFKNLAAVGIVFRLSEMIMGDKLKGRLRKGFLELAALGTVADMMPRKADNKFFIEEGLPSLSNSFRPGIKVFWKKEYFKKGMDLNMKVSKIISLLNVRDVKKGLPASYRLLTAPSLEEAGRLIERLLKKHSVRKKKIGKMLMIAEKKILGKEDNLIFEGGRNFESVLISSVASILCRDYLRPVFLFKRMEGESLGTARATSKTNLVSLMKKCSSLLITFGGHPQAAGFRIKNGNLEKFKKCLINNIGL